MGCGCKSQDDLIVQMSSIWANTRWKSKEHKKEANRRVEICLTSGKKRGLCAHNKNLYCKQGGGIWVPALALKMDEGCPINKWN